MSDLVEYYLLKDDMYSTKLLEMGPIVWDDRNTIYIYSHKELPYNFDKHWQTLNYNPEYVIDPTDHKTGTIGPTKYRTAFQWLDAVERHNYRTFYVSKKIHELFQSNDKISRNMAVKIIENEYFNEEEKAQGQKQNDES